MIESAMNNFLSRGQNNTELPGKCPPTFTATNSPSSSSIRFSLQNAIAPPLRITHSSSSAEMYTLHPKASAQCSEVE